MRKKLIAVIAASAAVLHSAAIRADVILEQMIQAGSAANAALGQSLVTPAGGPWNNLRFNWFDTGGAPNAGVPSPVATGTLFLLSQQYLGTPGTLNPATPGYIAQSQSIASNAYVFGGAVILQPNTTYYFYTNQLVPGNSGDGDVIPGGAYADIGTGGTYSALGGLDARFRLQGSVVPEPSSIALGLLTFACLLIARRSRWS